MHSSGLLGYLHVPGVCRYSGMQTYIKIKINRNLKNNKTNSSCVCYCKTEFMIGVLRRRDYISSMVFTEHVKYNLKIRSAKAGQPQVPDSNI